MRRVLVSAGLAAGILLVATPAQAFAHNAVRDPYLHAALDAVTLAVVAAPVVTAYLWGARRRGLLLALIALVQLPVAVAGFTSVADPRLHLTVACAALAVTGGAVYAVRRPPREPVAAPAVPG